jgi:hypothetical protein
MKPPLTCETGGEALPIGKRMVRSRQRILLESSGKRLAILANRYYAVVPPVRTAQLDQRSGGLLSRNYHSPPLIGAAGLRLADCRSHHAAFGSLVSDTAARMGVESRALAVRALLQLPRVASPSGWIGRRNLEREIQKSAQGLRVDARAAQDYLPVGSFALADLSFEQIDSDRADAVFKSLHYLRSARAGSLNFGLVDPINRRPVSLVSMSRLEWSCVRNEICAQFDMAPGAIWEVSRMYSFDYAPANVISYLLARLRAHLRRSGDSIDLLTTAVDQNLGFTGSSYKAANWQHWLSVVARPYMYEWGRYVTPRQLREWYGTSNPAELQARYPRRFERSRTRLLDSLIYCCNVKRETEAVPAQARRRVHRRPGDHEA